MAVACGLAATGGAETSREGLSAEAQEALHLTESHDPFERQLGFLRLEALREPGTAEAVRPHLDSKDQEVRAYSLRALAAIEGPKAVAELIRRLKTERHARVRRAAVLALETQRTADPAVMPALLEALEDRAGEVRMAAVDAVSRIDDPKAREALLARRKKEKDGNVRKVYSAAMKRMFVPDGGDAP
jgi:HEAT repeat protein